MTEELLYLAALSITTTEAPHAGVVLRVFFKESGTNQLR